MEFLKLPKIGPKVCAVQRPSDSIEGWKMIKMLIFNDLQHNSRGMSLAILMLKHINHLRYFLPFVSKHNMNQLHISISINPKAKRGKRKRQEK